jgi:4-hydroxy-tetrahydrodipicolinate synthase
VKLPAGVHTVLATPFGPGETLDEPSVGTLVEHVARSGAVGALALGVLGEADRLSDRERDRVRDAVLAAAAGRLAVTVGVSHASTLVAAERARAAESAGADAVMLAPPPGATGAALVEHYRRVGEAVAIPVVVQDHPASSGVRIPVEALAALLEELPEGSAVKLEDPPTAPKIRLLLELVPAAAVFGGLGGVALLHELDAGAAGTMTGFALPDVLVAIVEAHRGGEREEARRRHQAALPLLAFEAQPVLGLAVRKEILRRRGAIAHATLRSPAPQLDDVTLAALDELLGSDRSQA